MTTQLITDNSTGQNGTKTHSGSFLNQLRNGSSSDTAFGEVAAANVLNNGSDTRSATIVFTIPSTPAGESLVSATLYIYDSLHGADATIDCYGLLQTPVVGEVTWNSYSSGNAWNTPGAKGSGTDRNSSASDSHSAVSGDQGSYLSFDVTGDIGTSSEWLFETVTTSTNGIVLDGATATDGQRPARSRMTHAQQVAQARAGI